MTRPTQCIINLQSLSDNFNQIKKLVTPAKVLVLLKADAYGHGILQVASALKDADYFGVAAVEEGEALRRNGVKNNILCLGPQLPEAADAIAQNGIEQAVSDILSVKALERAGELAQKTVGVHIKIETGMHRTGIEAGQSLGELLEAVQKCPHIALKGVFTHFFASDIFDKSVTVKQAEGLKTAVAQISDAGFSGFIVHAANSGGILGFPEYYFDMVRSGIITYGYYPSDETRRTIPLKPVLTLKTAVTAINDVKAGETIGYGGTFTAKRDMRVAVLPIGYGDGYKRALSNKGSVLICGRRAPICGRICMDMTMVDVTDIPAARVSSEAVLIGSQGNESISADEIATLCDTISYEIMLSLTPRVPKIYVWE